MKIEYSPLNSNKNGSGHWFESRLCLLVPIFVLVVVLSLMLELLSLDELRNFWRNPLSRVSYDRFDQSPSKIRALIRDYDSENNISKLNLKSQSHEQKAVFGSREPLWTTPVLFDISNFRWLRNNASICHLDQSHPKARIVLILVHSARSHFSERLTIRKSWGSLLLYKTWSIRLAFLIGEADRNSEPLKNEEKFIEQETLLDDEQNTFADIVQGSFIDTYRNLTYKHMMGYKWILNFCPNASFVMKADDDMFVDLMRFLTWRDDDLRKSQLSTRRPAYYSPPDLYCSTFVGTKPQRCVGCKWHTSETEWPLEFYPDYCSGSCYGISVNLVKKLYSALNNAAFFWIDDVFATGILLEEAKKLDPGYEPQYRHLWGEMRALDFRNFRPMCERHDITMKRKFGTVVPVPRGSNFERDMVCLWNKTIYDDYNEHLKHQTDHNSYEDE